MNEENTKKIVSSFPNLYSNKDPREPFNYGGAHFQCGDGWFQLIYDLSEKIENILLTLNVRERANINVAQVKEKFGGLRFYYNGHREDINALVREAEKASVKTCEDCGAPGEVRGGNWLGTQCDACFLKGKSSK